MDRNRPLRALLLPLVLAAVAWSGESSVTTVPASDPIDTTSDDSQDSLAATTPSDTAANPIGTGSASSIDDGKPFENVVDPGASNERHWNFAITTSKSWVSRDTSTLSHNGSLSRTSSLGPVSFTPHLGFSWLSESPTDTSDKSLSAGAKLGWSPLEDHSFALDATWTTARGPDSWESNLDWGFDHDLSDWFALQLGANGGWSKDYRGSAQASLGGDFQLSSLDLSVGGTYTRRYETYLDLLGNDKTAYVNVWGWSTGLNWTHGHWTTGPSWSGETWKANTTAVAQPVKGKNMTATQRKIIRQASKIPANGIVLSQSFGWNTSWKPLPGIRFEFDLLKHAGHSTSAVNAKRAAVQSYVAANGQNPAFPDNSIGGSLGLHLSW